MRTIAQSDDPTADFNRRRLLRNSRTRGHRPGGQTGNRTRFLHHHTRRNPFPKLQPAHRIFGHRQVAIHRHALQGHALPRCHMLQGPKNMRFITHALGFKIPQHQSLRRHLHPRRRTPHVNIQFPLRRNRHLQRRHDRPGQILPHHPRHRLLQRGPGISLDQFLKNRTARDRQRDAFLFHRRTFVRGRSKIALGPGRELFHFFSSHHFRNIGIRNGNTRQGFIRYRLQRDLGHARCCMRQGLVGFSRATLGLETPPAQKGQGGSKREPF